MRFAAARADMKAGHAVAISLAVLSALFVMLFKWFPDAQVGWRNGFVGGLTAALLFNLGKLAIG